MSKAVRIGIIGCGGIANGYHLKDLSQLEGVQVVYYADRVESQARSTAERWKHHWPEFTVATDPEELLRSPEVDAVIVATHHATHAEFGVRAIEAGKDVLVQKPLGTRLEDANRFVDAAAAHPERVVQCFPFHWTAPFVRARELLEEGAIGRPVSARMRIAHQGPPRDSWFYQPAIAGFGASMDMGVYAISGLVALLGPAVSCSGLVGTFEDGVSIDDNAVWLLQFENGAFGTAETSWTQVTSVEPTVIYGTEGVITLGGPSHHPLRIYRRTSGVSWSTKGEWESPELPHDPPALSHRHFMDCLRDRRVPHGTPEQARHVVEILLAAHESSRTGQRVQLQTTVPGLCLPT